MSLHESFFNRFFSILLLFYFVYSLFLINIVLFRIKKLSFDNKNIKTLSIELNGYDLLLRSLRIA